MSIFRKKDKSEKSKSNPAGTVVKANIQNAQETAKTNEDLSKARILQDEVNAALRNLCNDKSLYTDLKRAATKNDKLLEEVRAAKEAESENGENAEKISDLLGLEENFYITSDEIDQYVIGLRNISRKFMEKTTVDAVKTGADRINVYTMRYINGLGDAIRNGKKLKAKCCFDLLLYILNVGYRIEDISDPKALEKRIQDKIEVVNESGKDLIALIDECYNMTTHYRISESNYDSHYQQYIQDYEFVSAIPEDVRLQIETLGFAEASRKFPANSEVRQKYLPVLVKLANQVTALLEDTLRMEAMIVSLVTFKADIDSNLRDFQVACNISGPDFDYEAHHKRMMERHKKNIAEINRINDMNAEALRMNNERMSMLKEAEDNRSMANAMSDVMRTIREQEKRNRKNEEMAKKIAEQRAANRKMQQELEELKEQETLDMAEEVMQEDPVEILTEDM